MKQEFKAENFVDKDCNPDGGYVTGLGLDIKWQKGPLAVDGKRVNPNGCFVETVLDAVLLRIKFYQDSKFSCSENREAIKHINEALYILGARTKRRERQGTEGTHKGN